MGLSIASSCLAQLMGAFGVTRTVSAVNLHSGVHVDPSHHEGIGVRLILSFISCVFCSGMIYP